MAEGDELIDLPSRQDSELSGGGGRVVDVRELRCCCSRLRWSPGVAGGSEKIGTRREQDESIAEVERSSSGSRSLEPAGSFPRG